MTSRSRFTQIGASFGRRLPFKKITRYIPRKICTACLHSHALSGPHRHLAEVSLVSRSFCLYFRLRQEGVLLLADHTSSALRPQHRISTVLFASLCALLAAIPIFSLFTTTSTIHEPFLLSVWLILTSGLMKRWTAVASQCLPLHLWTRSFIQLGALGSNAPLALRALPQQIVYCSELSLYKACAA